MQPAVYETVIITEMMYGKGSTMLAIHNVVKGRQYW